MVWYPVNPSNPRRQSVSSTSTPLPVFIVVSSVPQDQTLHQGNSQRPFQQPLSPEESRRCDRPVDPHLLRAFCGLCRRSVGGVLRFRLILLEMLACCWWRVAGLWIGSTASDERRKRGHLQNDGDDGAERNSIQRYLCRDSHCYDRGCDVEHGHRVCRLCHRPLRIHDSWSACAVDAICRDWSRILILVVGWVLAREKILDVRRTVLIFLTLEVGIGSGAVLDLVEEVGIGLEAGWCGLG
jgi:hypothetical protein